MRALALALCFAIGAVAGPDRVPRSPLISADSLSDHARVRRPDRE